jgi:hypothetical protein
MMGFLFSMDSDSLQYNGLTGDDRRNLANALGA